MCFPETRKLPRIGGLCAVGATPSDLIGLPGDGMAGFYGFVSGRKIAALAAFFSVLTADR